MELLVHPKEKVYFNFNACLVISSIMMSFLLFSTFAQARTAADVDRDLKKAARSSVWYPLLPPFGFLYCQNPQGLKTIQCTELS